MTDHALAGAPAEPTSEHKGTWTPEMKARLRAEYHEARAKEGGLQALADSLGVDLYQLYGKAHRMGLSRTIRRRGGSELEPQGASDATGTSPGRMR